MTAEMFKICSIDDGFLAIMARPSIDVTEPASVLNISRLGITLVVSLLEPNEARDLGLEAERSEVKALAMEFMSFPIPDMGLPPSIEDFASITRLLCKQISAGINTLVHCRAGIGRSGLFAAGVLLHTGMDPDQAFTHVSRMRGIRVPETPEQHDWLTSNYTAIVDDL
jgi:protein-tyrosine phosphatase